MLRQWIKDNSATHKPSRDGPSCTHTLFDGGRLFIQDEQMEAFLYCVANCMEHNEDVFVIERRPQLYRLFVDFDMVDVYAMSSTELLRYAACLQKQIVNAVDQTLPPGAVDLVVCTCRTKIVSKDGRSFVKSGVHLIWPRLFVSDDTALRLRQHLLIGLHLTFGERSHDFKHPWSKVIDAEVYKGAGLRMKGSKKMQACGCSSKDRADCSKCMGRGKLVDDRIYRPAHVLDKDGAPVSGELGKLDNAKEKLHKTSIRIPPDQHCTCLSAKDVQDVIPELMSYAEDSSLLPAYSGSRISDYKDVDNQNLFSSLNVSIQQAFSQAYFGIQLRSVQFSESTNTYLIRTDCKYCLCKGAKHASNHIYFVLSPGWLHQKCHDEECILKRQRKGHSSSAKLQGTFSKVLFPNQHATTDNRGSKGKRKRK